MFKVIGWLLAFYVGHCILTGRVAAKSGAGGRMVVREDGPVYFWSVIAIYSGLSVALICWF